MFVIKRNQVIITALVVMIAVAGYLNYVDTKSPKASPVTLNDTGELTDGTMDPTLDTVLMTEDMDMESALIAPEDDDPSIALGVSDPATDPFDPTITDMTDAMAVAETMADTTDTQSDVPGEAIFVSGSNGNIDSTYFVQAKLDREQVRAKQKDMLTDMINNANLDQTEKAQCAESLLTIQQRIEKESAAESMIEAKGFKGVYVRIDDSTVDVVVSKAALSDAEIAQIEDIVKRKTGMDANNIRISTIKQ